MYVVSFAVVMSAYILSCGGWNQAYGTPTVRTTEVVGSQAEASLPITVRESPNPKPTKQLAPQPKPNPTKVLPTSIPDTNRTTYELKLSDIPEEIPDYDRSDWNHWIDADGDCQNTRHEVLIEESLDPVGFKDERQCQVASGRWLAPYTGQEIREATKLDVDHMVPLKNAHDSGGWAWGKDRKAAYANEMVYSGNLIAVTDLANRSKGAKAPDRWKPPNQNYWCDYAIDWVNIKVVWDLTVTETELAALREMLKTCDKPPLITANVVQIPSSPPATPTVTPLTVTSDIPDIRVVTMDCKSNPETVVIENAGDYLQDMAGWKLEDDGPKHTFSFPEGFSMEPGSSLTLMSGKSGEDLGNVIYWKTRLIWNNDGDIARLFDSAGTLMAEMECP